MRQPGFSSVFALTIVILLVSWPHLAADEPVWDFSPSAVPMWSDDWQIQSSVAAIGNTLWATGVTVSTGRATIFEIDLVSGASTAYPLGSDFGLNPIALAISEGPGGNAWFIGAQLGPGSAPDVGDGAFLGEVTPDGTISLNALPSGAFNNNFYPQITYEPASGVLAWTQASGTGASFGIGWRTAQGEITTVELSAPGAPSSITVGPDANFYYTDGSLSLVRIGKVTPNGIVSYIAQVTYPQGFEPGPGTPPRIVAGGDGNLYFSDPVDNAIDLLTPSGGMTKFAIPTARTDISSLAYGQDGNIYFGERATGKVARLAPSTGTFTEILLPSNLTFTGSLNLLIPSPIFTPGWGAILATALRGPGLLRIREAGSACPQVRNRALAPDVIVAGQSFGMTLGYPPDHEGNSTGFPPGLGTQHGPHSFGVGGAAQNAGEYLASVTIFDSTQCPVDQVQLTFDVQAPVQRPGVLTFENSPPIPVTGRP